MSDTRYPVLLIPVGIIKNVREGYYKDEKGLPDKNRPFQTLEIATVAGDINLGLGDYMVTASEVPTMVPVSIEVGVSFTIQNFRHSIKAVTPPVIKPA